MNIEHRHSTRVPKFLKSLYAICNDDSLTEVIEWDPVTRSFIIIDLEKFTSSVLTQHYSHSNLSSFVRQLNNYGFSKLSRGDGLLQYFHKDFLLGKWDSLYKISKGTTQKISDKAYDQELSSPVGCKDCKHLQNRVAKLENTVSYLLQQTKEIKMMNQALTSYICNDKMKESLDKAEFNLEELLILGNKRKIKKQRMAIAGKAKESEYFLGENAADDSSDSDGSLDEIYDEKDFNKKFAFKKQQDRFDFEGF